MLKQDLIEEPRNKGFSNEEAYGVDVFGHGVNFTSAPEYVYDENGIDQMVWFVLNNVPKLSITSSVFYILTFRLLLYATFVLHTNLFFFLQFVHRRVRDTRGA